MKIKRLYNIGDIVTYKNKSYVVTGYEQNIDMITYQYELVPYSVRSVSFLLQDELEDDD